MKIMHPNYDNCLVNVSNSILKYYGSQNTHNTLAELDEYLKKDYKNVIILLYDGFGSNLIRKNLGDQAFLSKNKIKDITSVFPATTTASTTSVITGLTPMEHCWLGWDTYIPSVDKVVTMYLNTIKNTETEVADYNLAKQEFPYITIMDKINNSGNARAYSISPFEGIHYDEENADEMYDKIIKLCNTNEKKFIYAYCTEPDHTMHELGTEDERVIEIMKHLNAKTEELANKLNDTLLIVTADHGHITARDYIALDNYPRLKNMLIRDTSLEPRATNFFVKENMLEAFKCEFNKLFGNDFILLSKQEVLDKQLFGNGVANEKFYACLGDYISLAISDKAIIDVADPNPLKGLHAGITEDEVLIPLIVIDKK